MIWSRSWVWSNSLVDGYLKVTITLRYVFLGPCWLPASAGGGCHWSSWRSDPSQTRGSRGAGRHHSSRPTGTQKQRIIFWIYKFWCFKTRVKIDISFQSESLPSSLRIVGSDHVSRLVKIQGIVVAASGIKAKATNISLQVTFRPICLIHVLLIADDSFPCIFLHFLW